MKLKLFALSLLVTVSTFAQSVIIGGGNAPAGGTGGGGNGLLANLTAVWDMEDAANGNRLDSSGNSHTLVDFNSNTPRSGTHIQGSFSAGVVASTTSGLTNNDSAFKATTSFTVYGWFQESAAINSDPIVSRWGNDHCWIILGDGSGHLELVVRKIDDSGNTSVAVSTVTIDLNQNKWHMFVAGYDTVNNVNFISVDGETIVTASNTQGALRTTTDPLTLFNYGNMGSTANVHVLLDETAVWENRVLTQANITSLVGTFNFSSQAGTPLFFSGWN